LTEKVLFCQPVPIYRGRV